MSRNLLKGVSAPHVRCWVKVSNVSIVKAWNDRNRLFTFWVRYIASEKAWTDHNVIVMPFEHLNNFKGSDKILGIECDWYWKYLGSEVRAIC